VPGGGQVPPHGALRDRGRGAHGGTLRLEHFGHGDESDARQSGRHVRELFSLGPPRKSDRASLGGSHGWDGTLTVANLRHVLKVCRFRCPRPDLDAPRSARLCRPRRKDHHLEPGSEGPDGGQKVDPDDRTLDDKVHREPLHANRPRLIKSRRFFRIRSSTDIAVTASCVSQHDGVTILLGSESGIIFQGESTPLKFGQPGYSKKDPILGALDSEVPLDPDKLATAEVSEDDGDWLDPVRATFLKHTGKILDLQVRGPSFLMVNKVKLITNFFS
jgi:hypothetical protein